MLLEIIYWLFAFGVLFASTTEYIGHVTVQVDKATESTVQFVEQPPVGEIHLTAFIQQPAQPDDEPIKSPSDLPGVQPKEQPKPESQEDQPPTAKPKAKPAPCSPTVTYFSKPSCYVPTYYSSACYPCQQPCCRQRSYGCYGY